MDIKIGDIAKKLNISKATVSLALNDKDGVNAETKNLVKQTAEKMGYTPNAIAKNLAKRKNKNIGLIVPDITNPYYGNLVKHISDYTESYYDYNTVFATSNDNHHSEEKIIENFISERVGGVIIAPTNSNKVDHSYIRKLERYNIRYAFVTAYYPDLKAPYTMIDLEEGSYQLVSYLLDLGHRSICFLTSDPGVVPTFTRIRGYEKAFKERGIPLDATMFFDCKVPSFEKAYAITDQLIASKINIDAIITLNDIMALGALRALMERGVNVPGELSLAGYDNVIFSTVSTIPITTVNQDLERMSRGAVDMLFDMIKSGQTYDKSVLIEPELIIRRSTTRRNTLA